MTKEPISKNLLDHGIVSLIDYMGDDDAVVEAARVSYGAGTTKKSSDVGLIRYLMRHRHTTPFEMVEFKFYVKAPIFVFRQWHRHRTASINEVSGRYSEIQDEFYFPDAENTALQSTSNKQGREAVVSETEYKAVIAVIENSISEAYDSYRHLLGTNPIPPDAIRKRQLFVEEAALAGIRKLKAEGIKTDWTNEEIEEKIQEYYDANELAILSPEFGGLARELARIVLPLNTYSEMYWKVNLKNLLHFIALRADPHAQYEIRVYAEAMLEMIKEIVPISVQAFLDYEKNGARLSQMEVDAIRAFNLENDHHLSGFVSQYLRDRGVSEREIKEFYHRFL